MISNRFPCTGDQAEHAKSGDHENHRNSGQWRIKDRSKPDGSSANRKPEREAYSDKPQTEDYSAHWFRFETEFEMRFPNVVPPTAQFGVPGGK